MRRRQLTAMLLAACALWGCGPKEPPARPGAMRARPRPTTGPAATTRPTTREAPGRVVAAGMLQVGQRFIAIEDAMAMGRFDFDRLNGNLPPDQFRAEARSTVERVIALLVRATLALGEAERHMTDKQKEMIEAKVEYAKSRMITEAGGSVDQLKHKLATRGIELKQVLENERRKLTIDFYHQTKFMLSIVITRKMMWAYYTANRDTYVTGRKVRLRVIAVPATALWPMGVNDPTDEQKAAARAESLKIVRQAAKDLAAGQDFKTVARRVGKSIRARYGDQWDAYDFRGKSRIDLMADKGGLWPHEGSPAGFRDKVLAGAAAELEQGAVSKVEQTDRCCYLIQADHVIPARNVSFGDAQESILAILRRREYLRRENAYLLDKYRQFERLRTAEDRRRQVRFAQLVLDRVVADYCGKERPP